MSSFAPVVPIGVARWLKDKNLLGQYHLLLAHDVLAKPKEYAEVYSDPGNFIIMDNSLIELGKPMDVEQVAEAAHVVGAKVVVLPDALLNFGQTQGMVADAMEEMKKRNIHLHPLAVVQGKDDQEVFWFIDWLRTEFAHEIQYVSIPRCLTDRFGTRAPFVRRAYQCGYDIHLLGFSNHLIDDIASARMEGVMGIDSASPIRQALQDYVGISLDYPRQVSPRGTFWEDDERWCEKLKDESRVEGMLVYGNLTRVREWIKTPKLNK